MVIESVRVTLVRRQFLGKQFPVHQSSLVLHVASSFLSALGAPFPVTGEKGIFPRHSFPFSEWYCKGIPSGTHSQISILVQNILWKSACKQNDDRKMRTKGVFK